MILKFLLDKYLICWCHGYLKSNLRSYATSEAVLDVKLWKLWGNFEGNVYYIVASREAPFCFLTYLEFAVVVGDFLGAESADVGGLVHDVPVGVPRFEGGLVEVVLRLDVPPEHEGAMEYPCKNMDVAVRKL